MRGKRCAGLTADDIGLDSLFMFRSYGVSPALEVFMDNRINELRRKISALRLDMLDIEVSIRDQISNDRDCSESAGHLMRMRQQLTVLIKEWTLLGGGERLPTITERLRENYRPMGRPKPVPAAKPRPAAKPKIANRRLAARG
jgi:hypothetical protein